MFKLLGLKENSGYEVENDILAISLEKDKIHFNCNQVKVIHPLTIIVSSQRSIDTIVVQFQWTLMTTDFIDSNDGNDTNHQWTFSMDFTMNF